MSASAGAVEMSPRAQAAGPAAHGAQGRLPLWRGGAGDGRPGTLTRLLMAEFRRLRVMDGAKVEYEAVAALSSS